MGFVLVAGEDKDAKDKSASKDKAAGTSQNLEFRIHADSTLWGEHNFYICLFFVFLYLFRFLVRKGPNT